MTKQQDRSFYAAERKELVVIAAECAGIKRVGRIRIERIPDASAASLELFIKTNIAKGSTIHTDGWKSYGGVGALGYKHLPRKSAMIKPDDLLPRINIVTALLNRRTSKTRGLLFQRVLENAVRVQPAPYRKIVARKD